jgi:beta-N-acetylhexosaminidase
MTPKGLSLFLSLYLCFSFPCFLSALSFYDDLPPEMLAEKIARQMSHDELAGQILMLGYSGTEPSPEIVEWVRRYGIGGIKIFGWNTVDLSRMGNTIATLQRYSLESRFSIPLLVATDQEGGWVRHVRGETSITPGNLALGASNVPFDAWQTGYHIGRELSLLGINMNFAPTVDVYTHPRADVIGPRAFSSDPVRTAQLAVAYYRGMQKAGVISTAKHFPGHGATSEDSHGTLPFIHADFDTVWNRELVPYRFLIREDIPAIMSGHIAYPTLTDSDEPASLSRTILTDILREQLGYKGMIITDDMQMSGARISSNIVASSLQALLAGNDMIMVSRDVATHHRIRNLILMTMKDSREVEEIARKAVERILYTKLRYLKGEDSVPLFPDPEEIRRGLPDPEGRKFFLSHAFRSVSFVRNSSFPVIPEESGKVLLAGQLGLFFSVGRAYFPEADHFSFNYSPFSYSEPATIRNLVRQADRYDTIIFCLANPNSAEVLEALKESEADIYVLSVLTPVYLLEMPWVKNAVAVYGTGRDSIEAGFSALTGAFIPSGTVPIHFDPP